MANDGTDGPALPAPDLVASRKGWGPSSSQTLTKTSQGWTRNRTRFQDEKEGYNTLTDLLLDYILNSCIIGHF